MSESTNTRRTSLVIPVEHLEKIKKISKQKGQTSSSLIRLAIAEYIERNEKK